MIPPIPRARSLRRLVLPAALAAALSTAACKAPALEDDQFGGVRAQLPNWPERKSEGGPGAGSLLRAKKGEARVQVSWEADARAGLPTGEEALLAASLGAQAALVEPARRAVGKGVASPEVYGHAAALVESGGAQALVWRCDKSGRLLRLLREGAAPPLEPLAAGVRCHRYGDKPVDGDVPAASVALLGPGWRLARRNPGSAAWLNEEAVMTLFAAQLAPLPVDLVEAAHLVPGWATAAGLQAAEVRAGVRATGPQGHPALRFDGEARLDGRPVLFRFLWWRCLARGRTYGALVVTQARSAGAGAAKAASPGGDATELKEWTGRDAALLAPRCHG